MTEQEIIITSILCRCISSINTSCIIL